MRIGCPYCGTVSKNVPQLIWCPTCKTPSPNHPGWGGSHPLQYIVVDKEFRRDATAIVPPHELRECDNKECPRDGSTSGGVADTERTVTTWEA